MELDTVVCGDALRQCPVKAPFPYFGGKSTVAHIVWSRFGNVPNYVEPFFGSGAVLLSRPYRPGIETVNDLDCMLANFWRSMTCAADEVAHWADWPVNEADLLSRHKWLIDQTEFRDRMRSDPDHHDAKIAGWWVWGLCAWIGHGWCAKTANQRPHLGNAGQGELLQAYFRTIQDRMRMVRVCCGDWLRVLGPSPTTKLGLTGVFLDPPYASDRSVVYTEESAVAHDVRRWALENGDNPQLRIALCGYEGEHEMPGWECIAWKAAGGYASQGSGRGRENARKERIWFNKSCLQGQQLNMFARS